MTFFQNNRKKRTLSLMRSLIFAVLFVSTLAFSAPYAQAGSWGEPVAAARMKFMMETIRRYIEGALLGSLKVAAVQMLNQQVGQLIGGSSVGEALFITNFNDFLYQGPAQRTELYMNDFFTLTTRGKASAANYIGVGDSGGIGGNYASYLKSVGRQATTEAAGINTYNLEEYTPSPEAMFAEGDWRAFNAFFSNPANNPYGYSLQAEKVYQEKLAMEQQAATVKALSSGFLPAESNGTVITPAGAIEAVVADVSTLGNKVIAAASNPTEFLSGVVSAMANRMISNLIQRGVGQVQSNIQREVGNVSREVNASLNQATQQLGPGAQFINSTAQRLNVNVNTSTPPPASTGQ
jgi:hypothetical protein